MLDYIQKNGIDIASLNCRKNNRKNNIKAAGITATVDHFDINNPLYGKRCVFTGTLQHMSRKDAMQAVVNIGGMCEDRITKKTNYLILGNNDYCKSIKDGKSNKQKQAEKYKLAGNDIEIISEDVFYEMLAMMP